MAQVQLSDALLHQLHQRASQENLTIDEMLQRWLDSSDPASTADLRDELRQHRLYTTGPVVAMQWNQPEDSPYLIETYISPSVGRFGYSPEEFLTGQRRWVNVIHPEDVNRVLSEIAQARAKRLPEIQLHYRIFTADGKMRWIYVYAITVYDDPAEVARGYLIDVTGTKRAEETLRKNEAFLSSILESSLNGITVYRAVRDESGEIIDFIWVMANAGIQRLTGIPAAQLIGKRLLDVYPNDRDNGVFENFKTTVLSGESCMFEMSFSKPSRLWIMFSVVKLEDGVAVNHHDISRLKYTEDALRQSKNLYDELVDRIPGMVYRLRWEPGKEDEARYEYISPRVRELHGLEPEAVYANSRLIEQQLYPEDLRAAYAVSAIAAQTLNPVVWEGRYNVDGRVKWMRRESRPQRMPDGGLVWSGIETDITLEVEARDSRALAEAALHERERLEAILVQEQRMGHIQTQLIRTLSHEFRTPLAIMTTSINILERYFDRVEPAERDRRLSSLHFQIRQLTILLDDTTEILRGMVHHTGFHPHPVNLEQLCQVILTQIQTTLGEHHDLRFFSDGHLTNVLIDDRLMSRVLVNLLGNAIKYAPPKTEIRLELRLVQGKIVMRVIDRGIGIAPEDLSRLFEPFFRANNVQSVPGTGLGLSIVRDCVELHGGTIEVDSVLQQGTTFTIYLPVAAAV